MTAHADAQESQEDVLFQRLRSTMVAVHKQGHADQRSQHPKTHGVVQAMFQVHDVPEAYRRGVFAGAGCFAAWIRFSNGRESDDRKPDVHGMALKLLDVAADESRAGQAGATTQDFVLADHPVFFARDAADFLTFLGLKGKQTVERKTAEAGSSPAELAELDKAHYLQLLGPFPRLQGFFKLVPSPFTQEYFSQTPYRLGDHVVKYFVKPAPANRLDGEAPAAEDALRDNMRQFLTAEQRTARFEFGVEVRTDPATMTIEDASQAWNSPERVILATITIPPQEFLSAADVAFGEALSFSPWHALDEHQPLGSINQARRDAYEDSSATRHQATGALRREPREADLNLRTLTRYFESLKAGDYRGMQACLHPDVEFSDIGFDLRGPQVGAMWQMIIANGITVSFRDLAVNGRTGTAHWECDYTFRRDADAEPRPVHNRVDATIRFEGGLIREHRDACDFWGWFEQAMGPIGKGMHAFGFLEDKLEQLLGRSLPVDVEQRVRAKVRETAQHKIDAFMQATQHDAR